MNIGDTFVDPSQQTWTVEEFLGQGAWGRTFRARSEGGKRCVVKIALQASDFPADTPLPDDVVRARRDAAREQAALLEAGTHAFLPRLLGTFTVSNGTPALMLSHYAGTLERRISAGAPLTETVGLVAQVATALARAGMVHGNLRPSNILVNDRGNPVVSDPMTPATAAVLDKLENRDAVRAQWRPPEAGTRPSAMWDTWALCQALYQAALAKGSGIEARRGAGLDKVEIATLKDRALARFKSEQTNPRFRSRMADRLGAVLHRGLSEQIAPSPPYRFVDNNALAERLREVVAMEDPCVEDVGRLLPPGDAVDGVFRGENEVRFSVSVGTSAGVTNHEDVICGLKLIDLDGDPDERVPIPDAEYKVERHRSGRLRFQFDLPNLPPGRYALKIAFSVRDSGNPPEVAVGEFVVRPAPGYVPPAPPVIESSAPIMLDRVRAEPRVHAILEEDTAYTLGTELPTEGTQSGSDYGHSDAGAEIIEGLFPRPIAPPTDQGPPIPVEVQVSPTMAHDQTPISAPPIHLPRPMAAAGAGAYGVAPTGPSAHAVSQGTLGGPSIPMPSLHLKSATPAPAPPPVPQGVDHWLPGGVGDFGLEGDGLLPGIHGEGEDLPAWNSERLGDTLRSIPGFDQALEWLQRDAYTAFVAAAAGSFVLLMVMMALLKAF